MAIKRNYKKKNIASNHFQKRKLLIKIHSRKRKKYFTEIGPTLAKDVDFSSVIFHKNLEEYNKTQTEKDQTINEIKVTFFPLKLNKSQGYDELILMLLRNVSY